jgi:FMN phosphatase YigB (HAD superfamily)
MSWAGLDHNDFELYTTYENSCFAKPNLDYYREILGKLDLKAEECLMVGNDVSEDMVAEKLGMKVFLLTDCLLNKDNEDISKYPSGSFKELKEYIENII